jgi:hypothetical protein
VLDELLPSVRAGQGEKPFHNVPTQSSSRDANEIPPRSMFGLHGVSKDMSLNGIDA